MTDRPSVDPRARLVVVVVLVLWLALPLLLRSAVAQDALPFLVAGRLASHHPESVYNAEAVDVWDTKPRFAELTCKWSPPGTECTRKTVAFVSPPQALVLGWPLAALGPTWGVLVLRLLGAASLAGGFWLLWRRVATNRRSSVALAVLVLLLTPMAVTTVSIGQNTPLLFLSAALGVSVADSGRWRSAGVAGVLAVTVACKAFPLLLVAVLLWQRRWRLLLVLGALVATLTAGVALVAPLSVFGSFTRASGHLSHVALTEVRYGTLRSAAAWAWRPLAFGPGGYGPVVLAGAAIVGAWLGWVRHAGRDQQWAWAWLSTLLVSPTMWSHYLWLVFPAVLWASRACPPRLAHRVLGAACVLGALTIPAVYNYRHPNAATALLPLALVLTAWASCTWVLAPGRGGLGRSAVVRGPGRDRVVRGQEGSPAARRPSPAGT